MWTEQRLKKYREKAEISRFKPFEHEIRWHGYKMATDVFEGEGGTHSEFMEGLLSIDMKKTCDDLACYMKKCV